MTKRSGFALRRLGSCALGETVCGPTWNLTATSGTFYRCCPGELFCGIKRNGACCSEDDQDCTDDISNPALCADQNWDLFQNPNGNEGRFCCEQGKIGFVRSEIGVGCANEENITQTDTMLSAINPPGVVPTSTTSSTSTASTSNAGAIAGGVVGGVAGLAIILALFWYFIRRSQKQPLQAESAYTEASIIKSDPTQLSGEPSELDGHPHKPNELDGQAYIRELESTPTYELPDNSKV
ncbi:hypothetical protein N7536_010126 [Penicillium majusculum]|uniref:Uncharacterized protein n=1 Tax=Penicillium solitum TaxID=60172 RepID=A0A1V6QXE4_9EURO|nr:uncharacterized protein PENSOL_c030G04194 [Penicillium solitum]KAJ5687507.1 hypothetical protein N7536_010126 [Penicillium majusculum]OQD93702.1 hypothetical protein PENSOL_c030G04194 [Penicillium solitum]